MVFYEIKENTFQFFTLGVHFLICFLSPFVRTSPITFCVSGPWLVMCTRKPTEFKGIKFATIKSRKTTSDFTTYLQKMCTYFIIKFVTVDGCILFYSVTDKISLKK
jgi:hypothetical protein